MVVHAVSSLPWYTYVALFLLALATLGFVVGLVRLGWWGLHWWFWSSWTTLLRLLAWLCPWLPAALGTARWSTTRDVTRHGLVQGDGLPLGQWGGQVLREPTGGHVALIGPPRSRKSWGLIMPAIVGYPGSVVATDLRGELHTHTHEARSQQGPVYRFAPAQDDSCSLNLLDAVRWSGDHCFGDLHRLVVNLFGADLPTGEPIFRRLAIPCLEGVAAHLHSLGQGNWPAVIAWMLDPDQPLAEKLAALVASSAPLARQAGRRLCDMSQRLQTGVWAECTSVLTLYQDPVIAAHTRTSDIALGQLLASPDPLTAYCIVDFPDIRRLQPLMSGVCDALLALAGGQAAPARHRLLLALDECANLGRLDQLASGVSYLQGSGVQVLAAFQTLHQPRAVYGHDSPLLASMSTHVYYRPTPGDTLTAQAISTALGVGTVLTTSLSADEGDTPLRTSVRETARALLTPDEVARLDDEAALILTQGCPPILARKLGTAPVPLRTTAWRAVRRHPLPLAGAVAAWLLVLALQPLQHLPLPQPVPGVTAGRLGHGTPAPALPATATPTEGAVPPSPPLAPPLNPPPTASTPAGTWLLRFTDHHGVALHFTDPARVVATFATREACQGALPLHYGPMVQALAMPHLARQQPQVRRGTDRWSWEHSPQRGERRRYEAWCEAQTAG